MEKIKLFVIFVKSIFILYFSFCTTYEHTPVHCSKIEGIPGPEDFVWMEENKIFLISSYNRRDLTSLGEIFSYNIQNNTLQILARKNEPQNLSFRPHGIDYKKPYLFVILHGDTLDTKWHAVAVYELKDNTLIFKTLFEHPLIVSPNDLKVISYDQFFITNDMETRNSFWEYFTTIYFGRNKGSILLCDIQKNDCYYVYKKIGFPNSIEIYNNKLYVTATLQNTIYEFQIEKNQDQYVLKDNYKFNEILGPDNLILYNSKIYTTSHPSNWKFLQHSKSTDNKSPSIGYEITPESHTVKKVFEDDGKRISAASVLIKLNQEIFLGQVFDPFILRCKITE